MSARLPASSPRGPTQPGEFQYQDIGGNPTDDPLAAMDDYEAQGGKRYARLAFACPAGKGECVCQVTGLLIGHPDKPAAFPSWQWDGNVEQPTLKPSINCTGGCGWHGYLTKGEFA